MAEYEGFQYPTPQTPVKIIEPFLITRFQDRFSLYTRDGEEHAHLVKGRESLDRYHEGAFEVWVAHTVEKRVATMRRQIARSQKKIEEAEETIRMLGVEP